MVDSSSALQLGSPPMPRTRLIGREDERSTARSLLLDEAVPLLTLVGPGGVGKTRLALAIAQDVTPSFADGVVWVDLAPVMDPNLVPGTLAAAIKYVPTSDQPIASELARYLRPRQTLLLLDNCEHLAPAVADLVAGLLAACPAVHALATRACRQSWRRCQQWRCPEWESRSFRATARTGTSASATPASGASTPPERRRTTDVRLLRGFEVADEAELVAERVGHDRPLQFRVRLREGSRRLHQRATQDDHLPDGALHVLDGNVGMGPVLQRRFRLGDP